MIISFNKEELLNDLKLLAATLSPNLGVTFLVEKNIIYVTDSATESYMQINKELSYEGDPQIFTLNLSLLIEICSSLNDENISLEIKQSENKAIIKHKHGEYKLRLFLTTTPGTLDIIDNNVVLYETTKKNFSDLLARIKYAMDNKDVRPMLQGVALSYYPENKVNVFCATDAFRLATWGKVPVDFTEKETYIIPPEIIKIIPKLPVNNEDKVSIAMNNEASMAMLKTENVILLVRFLTGTFPPFEKLLPKEEILSTIIPIKKAEIKDILQRIKPLISKDSEGIIQLIFSKDKIIFKTESSDNSEAKEELILSSDIDDYPDFIIKLRLAHLLDALNSFSDEENLDLAFQKEEGKAILLRSKNKSEQISLTMPKVI